MLPDILKVIQAITIGYAAVVLYGLVGRLQPNRRLGLVLQVMILVAAAAAITNKLLPQAGRRPLSQHPTLLPDRQSRPRSC
jgi:hypothetical protein